MTNHNVTSPAPGRLVLRWVPVTDERGRTHMEARWSVAPDSHAASPHAA